MEHALGIFITLFSPFLYIFCKLISVIYIFIGCMIYMYACIYISIYIILETREKVAFQTMKHALGIYLYICVFIGCMMYIHMYIYMYICVYIIETR
jgi:hypothetical protein